MKTTDGTTGSWRMRVVPPVLAALLLGLMAPGASAAPTTARSERERVVVTFAQDATRAERTDVLADLDTATTTHSAGLDPLATTEAVPAVVHATDAQQATLAADERVRHVEKDIRIHADAIAVRDPAWQEQNGVRRIGVNQLWAETTGDADVVIAVVDTGVDPANKDLTGRLVEGHDFVNRDSDPRDDNGHGTAVATIVAAASNSYGVAGICWRCRVMPVKVLDASGKGYLSDAALGISWAVKHGADIVNVSLGAPSSMAALDTALAEAKEAGVLVVASAGNAGNSIKQWPAADARVMGVAALNAEDRRATYSSYGPWVDVAAPGCNQAGWLDKPAINFCGTSSAAPLVSGTAALLSSVRDTPSDRVRAVLRSTAVAAGSGMGSGRIDAMAAFRALPRFSDVSSSVHAENIEVLADAGVTTGCTAAQYCPLRKVTRGQIATFLDRALDLPPATVRFADVPDDHPHATGIAAVAAAGITTGCDEQQSARRGPAEAPARVSRDAKFCPSDQLTRGQMASLLQRALKLADGPPRFADVAPTHSHAEGIWAIAAAGVTTGCTADRYCPGAPVDRAQMASFLVRALDL